MSLLQNWRDIAYNQEADKKQLQQFWTNYFLIEKTFTSSFFPTRMKW